MFAATDSNSPQNYSPNNYVIQRTEITSGVRVAAPSSVNNSYLFISEPPTVTMYVSGVSGAEGTMTLKAGTHTASLKISPFGKVKLSSP